MNKRQEKVVRIAERYGYEAQSRQCIEEMAELTQAINKFWRVSQKANNSDSICEKQKMIPAREHILEEIADVQIMLWQIAYLLNGRRILDYVDAKLDRQIKRIENQIKG